MTTTAVRSVRISSGSHRVKVVAADGAEFRVDGSADMSDDDGQITVGGVASRLTVFVPARTDVVIGTTSGRVDVEGPAGHVAVVTSSGRVEIEQAASVDVRSQSSRVEIGTVEGSCRVRSESGRVEVTSCGAADVAAKSGRIEMRHVDGDVAAHSVSGRIELSLASTHDVRAETVSGKIEVSLPEDAVAFQPTDISAGELRPRGCNCTVLARSTSGKVTVASR